MSAACRDDGRCQHAIDHGAEGLAACPVGKCCMPRADHDAAMRAAFEEWVRAELKLSANVKVGPRGDLALTPWEAWQEATRRASEREKAIRSVLADMVKMMDDGDEHGAGSEWHTRAVAVLAAAAPTSKADAEDAARYRWLCANNFDKTGQTQVHTWVHSWEPHSQTGEPTEWKARVRGSALDRAIDAALAAKQAEEVKP